jgi:hypothetical protein
MEKVFENIKVSNEYRILAQVLALVDNQMTSREQAVVQIFQTVVVSEDRLEKNVKIVSSEVT